ncbi:hypothetical protein JTB14_008328 [Gonioctena quinquepunctata]|nr:hypothetical protein JTB14_008328 [Gonioctena quinquepunctata]
MPIRLERSLSKLVFLSGLVNISATCSSEDISAESHSAYIESMPWLVVPFQQTAVRAELAELFGIRGIPTLLLLDSNGHIITMDARTELAEDPLAQYFPWRPRAVNMLTERYLTKLYDYPAVVLFVDGEDTEVQFAESVLLPAAENYYKTNNINFSSAQEDYLNVEEDPCLQFLIGVDNETSDILRDLIGLDDAMPLLVAIDLPARKFAVMEYGIEINNESVNDFVMNLLKNDLDMIDITDEKVEGTKNC